jgi:hypothetical protein
MLWEEVNDSWLGWMFAEDQVVMVDGENAM